MATGVTLLCAAVAAALDPPVVPALGPSRLDPGLKGLVLIEELRCAACHPSAGDLAARSKKAPRLAGVGSRLHPAYLEGFIRDPRGTKPGTTMPDVMARLSDEERRGAATALTHFLLSLQPHDFALQPPDRVAAQDGKRLFHSRGCAACHAPRDDRGKEIVTPDSAPLGALEGKYSFRSLVEFLRQPLVSRPSGRMPDMQLPDREVERIAHFLLQDTRVPGSLSYTLYRGQVWEGLESGNVNAERAGQVEDFALESLGPIDHHTAIRYEGLLEIASPGRYRFFLRMNGGSLLVDGEPVLGQEPSDRRGVKELAGSVEFEAGWHSVELTYFHTGREPEFSFEMEGPGFPRRPIPASMLSVSREPVPRFEAWKVDPGLAARGRELFGELRCASCHEDAGVASPPARAWAGVDPARGCLGESVGAWPRFDLAAEQRGWIAQALPRAAEPRLGDLQEVDKTLVTFNCITCHDRAGLGGMAPERNALFTGAQPGLGDQGRLPPPLSHVGAKLRPEWIAEVLLRGGRQRDYVDAAMPQFGEANVGHLVELFGRVDSLEEAELPAVDDLQESKDAGYEMVGMTGLGCIGCHSFNGQKSGEMSALDIGRVTERLQKNWFSLYMRQPSRFHPTGIMPSFWPDGQSVRPGILGGDAAQQIEALWAYLEDGASARKPVGLSRVSDELRVGDVTEICRGQSPVGYRGIAVGYPERIHLAFDAGEMALRMLWKGEFASVEAGRFQPRGTDQIAFPPGIPFHRLPSLEDSWPYKGKTNHAFPQDHGYEFRGYHLDAARRPVFLYHYGEIAVEDSFEDALGEEGRAYFKRVLTFETPAGAKPFYFRAAAGKEAGVQDGQDFTIDALRLRITSEHRGIVREGDPAEVLILLAPPAGRSAVTLEYRW